MKMKNKFILSLLVANMTMATAATANEQSATLSSSMSILTEEVEWINLDAIALAIEHMGQMEGFDKESAQRRFDELRTVVSGGFDGLRSEDGECVARAKRAVQLKKEILLSNPLIEDKSIMAVKYKLSGDVRAALARQLGTPRNNWTSQIDNARQGYNASIIELSNLVGEPNERTIYSAPRTSPISDFRMHWDSDRFTFTQINENNLWRVHQMKLSDLELEEVVDCDEPDLEFFDAIYLPDGRYIVNSNIGYNGVPCVNGTSSVSNMMIYDPKEKSLRQISFDQDSNWNPVVMNNGRVMYTRWEYTDLTHYYSRIVMHMNPDGTENKALYGSGGMFPNSTYDIQPLQNYSSAFIAVISGHHGIPRSGRLMIIDPLKSRKGAEAMVHEFPYRGREIKEEIKDRLVDGVWPQFVKPHVVSDDYFLVAAKLSESSLWGIYLVDVFDNLTCLYQVEGEGFISPQLVRKNVTPPAIPDKVILGEKEATFFIQDIYEGEGLIGIPRGTVKEVRLFAYEYAYLTTTSDHDWQGIQSGWDIKRLLGTVPVEDDGSVMFTAPANTPISIQPIDGEGVAVQWMRSWVVGQPGEIVSCVGCHENQNQIAIPKRYEASLKPAVPLIKPEGGVRSFTFDLEVQPILDRACISCHNGEKRAFDLRTGEKDKLGFGPAYMNIMPYVRRQGGEGDMAVLVPYEYHPNTSELVRMLKKGHYNVELTEAEWRKLYAWIDFNAPDKGNFDDNIVKKTPYRENPLPDKSQYKRRIELKNKYAGGMGVDWRKEIADYADYLASQGEIKPEMPVVAKQSQSKPKSVNVKGFKPNGVIERKCVEVAPGVEITFVKIPAGEFAMGSNSGEPDAMPMSKVKIKSPFWMAELEITNEQVRALLAHDSKYVDQMWKDHVVPGYVANDPDQPAIRISYNKVMEYCKLLSEKSGLNITLPTEAQWEWACRAGSTGDFWYGDLLSSDFGTKENLADKTTLKFAVNGVDPKPMSPSHERYQHYTYLPKDVNVDDGELVMVGGKRYEANPFGLYNMHGNVAEWTRSCYAPYPFNERAEGEYMVVRGGSYFERPKYSTSHSRKYYYPYQAVFNVGFRLIIEE